MQREVGLRNIISIMAMLNLDSVCCIKTCGNLVESLKVFQIYHLKNAKMLDFK